MKTPPREKRTFEELRQHYEVEKELAGRLRNATKKQRTGLYAAVYDELFRRVPSHPQVTAQCSTRHEEKLTSQLRLLEPFLLPNTVFLEVGGGDCALSLRLAQKVQSTYAVEITNALVGHNAPSNFQLVLSDGSSIPLPDRSIDVAFSFSVIEHVHPDDVVGQLAEIHRVLKPGGLYLCVTPNRLSGPHDISRHFDSVATGLHLREYSTADLAGLLRSSGFAPIWIEKVLKSHHLRLYMPLVLFAERLFASLPWRLRSRLGSLRLIAWAFEVSIAGRKDTTG